ncbi:hypothetical protein, conserved [Babesia ovata]|uniref:6-Cys domain-containing protein n=1 Tax=Babesia ovata TaxID=189622 RepID=A0A2H6K7X0_9APIC|nr:uncharacterized protein BOVATA_005770 [Babesia ovata]GBE59084.1 hypothetical protein, conserved [Babesia ovata]
MRCDFGEPDELLISNALVMCHMDIDDFSSAIVVCPRRVDNVEYILHPRPTSDGNAHLNTYVSDEGVYRAVSLSDVFVTESPVSFASVESDQMQNILHIELPTEELFAITERRWIFICGPRNLNLSDALQRQLDHINGAIQIQDFPWTPVTPLSQEISKIGHGLGVFVLYGERMYLRLQGCGSHPSPLFAPGNEVIIDPVTATRSCVADPMSESRIGFLCEGRIEPEDCMRSLIDSNGEVVATPEPHLYWGFGDHRPWVAAKYFEKFALPPFSGECKCVDSETGQVKARIEIRSKTEYICDIASKVFRDRYHPIRGPWCSVVLHPGSTLTIMFPIEFLDSSSEETIDMDVYEASPSGPLSQEPPRYLFKTEFLPKDLTTLRQLSTPYDVYIYEEVLYQRVIAGDALELDVSQMHHGEVKLTYYEDKPLALRRGSNSFFYHWILEAINNYVFDGIRAAVNISLAFTHYYDIVGCDRGPQHVFDPDMSKDHCSVKSMGNGIGDIYECSYHITWDGWQVGIYCRPDEELLPNNCESTGYDLSSNKVMQLPESVRNATTYPIRGFHVFDLYSNGDTPLNYACVCVDQRGYEKSKLILKYTTDDFHTYKVHRAERPHRSLLHMLLPWREVGLSIDGLTSPESLTIHYVPQSTITIEVGRTLLLHCENGLDAFQILNEPLNVHANPGRETLRWLPDNPEEFYYTVFHTPNGPELIRQKYEDSMAMSDGALDVYYTEHSSIPGYLKLEISSHRGSIIISKDPLHKRFVPMTFVCGKSPQPSDLSIMTGDGSTSGTSAQPTSHIRRMYIAYTWHVVEVDIETTDPYMQGCGVTYSSDVLFKPETPQLYDADGQLQLGCKIDLQAAKETAFYCPAPYVLDPPNCFSQVYVDGVVKNMRELSKSLVSSRSNHFVILRLYSSLIGPEETLRQAPPLECRCVTVKGIILSTIQIENYYAK